MDPSVRFGKPCIAGTHIDVATVVGAVGAGDSVEAVQEAFSLTREQVLAAVRTRPTSPPTFHLRSEGSPGQTMT
ncbi:MAG: DUF433 domain-containing protein [Pseudonocardiaceae bacterium]